MTTNDRPADDPAAREAAAELERKRREDGIRRLVDTFPPVTPAQRVQIVRLFRSIPPVGTSGTDGT
jgi:hypothetical protein